MKGALPTVTLLVVLAALPAPAPARGGSRSYSGRTTGRAALHFRLSGSTVSGFAFKSRFHCSNHTTFVSRGGPYNRIHVRRGAFDVKRSNRAGSLSIHITGRIRGRGASGTIFRKAIFDTHNRLSPSGSVVCTSNTSWSARSR